MLKLLLLTWNFIIELIYIIFYILYSRIDIIDMITCSYIHVCILPPDNHEVDGSNDPSFMYSPSKSLLKRYDNLKYEIFSKSGSASPPTLFFNTVDLVCFYHKMSRWGSDCDFVESMGQDESGCFLLLDIQRMTIIQSGLKNSLCDERDHVNQMR